MNYVMCSSCGKRVSNYVKEEMFIRAYVECPECIEKQDEVGNVAQPDSVQPQLAEVRAGGSLANKLSNCVHDNCKDVPHDIGLKLISIVREHLV